MTFRVIVARLARSTSGRPFGLRYVIAILIITIRLLLFVQSFAGWLVHDVTVILAVVSSHPVYRVQMSNKFLNCC